MLERYKKKSFKIWAFVSFVLLTACILRIVGSDGVYECADIPFCVQSGETRIAAFPEEVALRPGIYQVELAYAAEHDAIEPVAYCSVQADTPWKGGIYTNGTHIYAAPKQAEYCVWVCQKASNLQLVIDYHGEGALTVEGIVVRETRQSGTAPLVIAAALSALWFGMLLLYDYDKKHGISREARKVALGVFLIGFAASVPYLHTYSIQSPDLVYHMQRIEGLKDGWLGGQFPVRLEPEWVFGHGYADAVFYCNRFLVFPAVLRMLGFTVSVSHNLYCILLNFVTAGVAWYCFGKIFGNNNTGLLCSALYTLSVYRIYKLVLTGAIGEVCAMIFMPVVIYGLYLAFSGNVGDKRYRKTWIPLCIGYAGLVQTHVLTCEITVLVTLALCVVFLRRVLRPRTFLQLLKGAAAALGVSLWFLVPFVDYYLTQDVEVKHMDPLMAQDSGLDWAHMLLHFWRPIEVTQYAGIGFVLAVGGIGFIGLWITGRLKGRRDERTRFAKVMAVMGTALVLMSLKYFPWKDICAASRLITAFVGSLQYIYRFLGWGTVCLVFTAGYCLNHVMEQKRRLYPLAVFLVIAGVATSTVHLSDYAVQAQNNYYLYNDEGFGSGYLSGGEYLLHGTDRAQLTYADTAAGQNVEIAGEDSGSLYRMVACSNQGGSQSYIEVPFFAYKGYQARDLETGERMDIEKSGRNTVRVLLPPGYAGRIEIRYVPPLYWRISEIVSAASALGLAAVYMRNRRKGIYGS